LGADRSSVHRFLEEGAVALTAEVLAEWREAERVLGVLADDAPERPAVAAAVEEMRELYRHVARDMTAATANAIAQTRTRIDATHALLREVREAR
jgi:hypothetical protein